MAAPWGVPFSKSSSFDWVQRRVPCAGACGEQEMKAARTAASAEKPNAERKWQMVREEADILPLSLLKSRDSGILTAIVFGYYRIPRWSRKQTCADGEAHGVHHGAMV